MSAGKYNFIIEKGATFTRTFTYKDPSDVAIDLTGAVIYMQIRDNYSAEVAAINIDSDNIGGNGGITISDPATGVFVITITDEQTTSIPFAQGVYDIEIHYGNGSVERVLEGRVKVKPQVTQ